MEKRFPGPLKDNRNSQISHKRRNVLQQTFSLKIWLLIIDYRHRHFVEEHLADLNGGDILILPKSSTKLWAYVTPPKVCQPK